MSKEKVKNIFVMKKERRSIGGEKHRNTGMQEKSKNRKAGMQEISKKAGEKHEKSKNRRTECRRNA